MFLDSAATEILITEQYLPKQMYSGAWLNPSDSLWSLIHCRSSLLLHTLPNYRHSCSAKGEREHTCLGWKQTRCCACWSWAVLIKCHKLILSSLASRVSWPGQPCQYGTPSRIRTDPANPEWAGQVFSRDGWPLPAGSAFGSQVKAPNSGIAGELTRL